uniref:Uncharacterized protein n=1 Tax=Arundo donax TaxID=35708 RepID=A0A0A9EM30_ARUDO
MPLGPLFHDRSAPMSCPASGFSSTNFTLMVLLLDTKRVGWCAASPSSPVWISMRLSYLL